MFLNSPSAATMWHSSQPLNVPQSQGSGPGVGAIDAFNAQFQKVAAASSAAAGGAHPAGRQNSPGMLAPPSHEQHMRRDYPRQAQAERRTVIASPHLAREAEARRALAMLQANDVEVTEVPWTANDENDPNIANLRLVGTVWLEGGAR